MLAFTVFGIGVLMLSLMVAYGKSTENKKKFMHQLIVIIGLLVIWLVIIGIKSYLLKSGFTIDKITVKQAGAIELIVNTIYPFIIAPLIAMFIAIFKVVK